MRTEQRQYDRVEVEFPVVYRIGKNTVTGSTLNACNEGILVESFLSSRTALKIFKILNRNPGYSLEVEYTYGGNTYRRNAQIRHFHSVFSGHEPYRFRVGFYIPKTE